RGDDVGGRTDIARLQPFAETLSLRSEEGAADDGRLGTGRRERGDVCRRPHAARREHAESGRRYPTDELDVGPGEGAVTVDRSAEDAGDASLSAATAGLVDRQARRLRP